jgi:hypothetical protein
MGSMTVARDREVPVRKVLARLFVVVMGVVMVGAVQTAPAAAWGGETLGCRVSGFTAEYYEYCSNDSPASSYGISFRVAGGSGTYTYDWTVTGDYISYSCPSWSEYCGVETGGSQVPRAVNVSVTITQGGLSRTLYSRADIVSWCGTEIC